MNFNLSLYGPLLFLISCIVSAQAQVPIAIDDLKQLSYKQLDSTMMVCYKQKHYENAIKCTKEGEARAMIEFGEMDSVTNSYLANSAFLYRQWGKKEVAEAMYWKAIRNGEKIWGKFHSEQSTILENLGNLYTQMGRYEAAEELFLEEVEIRTKIFGKEHLKYARALNFLGNLYQEWGKFDQAEPIILEALEIKGKQVGEEHPDYAIYLNNLAQLYQNLGRYEESIELHLRAMSIREKTLGKEHGYYINSLSNLASSYRRLFQYDKAVPLYEEAKELCEKMNAQKTSFYTTTLNNLAIAYSDLGKNDLAKPLYFKVLGISEQLNGRLSPSYSHSLNNTAFFFINTNELDSAYAYCIAGIAANSYNFEAIFPNAFAPVDQEGMNPHSPHLLPHFFDLESLEKLRKLEYLNDSRTDWSLKTLMKIIKLQYDALVLAGANEEEKKAKLLEYYVSNRVAMKIHDDIRNDFSGSSDKLRILRENYLHLQHGLKAVRLLDSEEYYSEAFSFAEQNKSILMMDAFKGDKARNLGDLPDSLVQKEEDLQAQKALILQEKIRAKDLTARTAVAKKEAVLNTEIELFLKSLKGKYPKYHALKYEQVVTTAEDIQASLDQKSLLLEYFVSDTTTYLFAVSKTAIKFYALDIQKPILAKKIESLHQALSNYKLLLQNPDKAYERYVDPAYWFYKELLEGVLKDVETSNSNIKNLIVIADGELGHLPFEAFLRKAGLQGKNDYKELHYLVNDYSISYNYSATLWKQNKESETFQNNNEILACAASYAPEKTAFYKHRIGPLQRLRKTLQPLPAVKKEVQVLEDFVDGTFLYESGESGVATEANFKKNAKDYGIIHLAMHGILNVREPMKSSLAFTEDQDSLEDNFLEAFEISRMELNANLVVLSACETGYGKFEQGEGILSLARSFMYAGVPSLVVSLWQVNDNSTSIIMSLFYHNLADGMPKDVALRQAKLDFLKAAKGVLAHPAFWSPFIQLGDSRAIQLQKKGKGGMWLWFGLGVGILGLCLMLLKRRT